MYVLLYRSVATAPLSEAEVRDLARRSADANVRNGITGLLLYAHVASHRGGLFMQWIEGAQEDVTRLYHGRIAHDRRHTDCEVLYEGASTPLTGTDARVLPTWSMRPVVERLGLFPASADAFLTRLPLYAGDARRGLPTAVAQQRSRRIEGIQV
ncbi:MAG: BLUF domain-containing protein [Bacteroidota bacterium]